MTQRIWTTVYAANDLPTEEAHIVSKSLGTVDTWSELEYTVHEHGTGLFKGKINRHLPQAALLVQDRYLLVHTDAGVVGGTFLEQAPIDLSSAEGPGDEWMTWGGRGQVAILARGMMDDSSNIAGGHHPITGYWDLDSQGIMAGASNAHPIPMYKRAVVEMLLNSPSGIDEVDHSSFDYDLDSDGNAVPFLDGEAQGADVGDDGLTLLIRMDQLGGVVFPMSPLFKLDAYLSHGTDRSGAFGSSTVRLEKGVNAAAAIARTVRGSVYVSHLLVGGAEYSYRTVVDPDWSAGDVVRRGFLAMPEASDPTQLDAAGLAHIERRKLQTDAWEIPLHDHGDDPANGVYEPAPDIADGHFWLGDTITLHTGTGAYDSNEEDTPVSSIQWKLKTGEEANGDYVVIVGIGSIFGWSAAQASSTTPGSQHNIHFCDHSQLIETSTAWKIALTGTPPAGWEDPGFDDSSYGNAVHINHANWYDTGSSRWIWDSAADPQPSGEERSFRREFVVGSIPTHATLLVSADNGCLVYLNGTEIADLRSDRRGLSGGWDWTTATTIVVDPSLFVVGANCLSIIGWNETHASPGLSGVYAALTVGAGGTDTRVARCDHPHIIEQLLSQETDTSLELHPDGNGGVAWIAPIPETPDAVTIATELDRAGHGRLIASVQQDDPTGDGRAYVCYSDDDGETLVDLYGTFAFVPDNSGDSSPDPSMIHWDGQWWMAYTNSGFEVVDSWNLWRSPDLSPGSWVKVADVSTAALGGTDTWAPDWARNSDGSPLLHPSTGTPIIIVTKNVGGRKLYEMHPTNRGMTAWSTPVHMDGIDWTAKRIDGHLIYAPEFGDGTPYKLWFVDSEIGNILYAQSASLTTGYDVQVAGNWAGWGTLFVGPSLVRLEDGRWRIFFNTTSGGNSTGYSWSDSFDDWATWTSPVAIPDPGFVMGHSTFFRLPSAYDHQRDPYAHPGVAGVTDHGALTGLTDDDHTQYQRESEKGAAAGYASLDGSTKVPIAELPTGTSSTTVALGDHGHGAAGLIPVDTGTVAYDTSDPDELGITVTSDWGYDGGAYYDDAGAAAGEEASLWWDPATGQYAVITFDFP